ncbi:DgsA anti-repressor MtfA, partial [Raoultella planticola]
MMFKWPWKVDEESGNAEMPWEHALAIPVLANLSAQEQQELVQMAARFLQQ